MELAWSIHSKRALTHAQMLANLSSSSSGDVIHSSSGTPHVAPVVPWYKHAPALLLSLGVWVASARCMTFTSMCVSVSVSVCVRVCVRVFLPLLHTTLTLSI